MARRVGKYTILKTLGEGSLGKWVIVDLDERKGEAIRKCRDT